MSQAQAVIVANPGAGAAVLDALRDWSALGLVGDFLWVSAPALLAGDASTRALLVRGGQGWLTTVAEHIADSPNSKTLRVCALDTLTGPAELLAAQGLLRQLAGGAGGNDTRIFGMTITRVHVIPVGLLGQITRPIEVSGGWHSLILPAEDRYGPEEAVVKLNLADRGMCAMHTAAGLTGLLGLWSGVPSTVLDTAGAPSQQLVRLARAYFRSVDADHVAAELGGMVTDTTSGLPRTCRDGEELPTVDSGKASVEAADLLLILHPEVRSSVPPLPPGPEIKPIGWWRMLRMFLAFLWSALRNAPRDWARGVVASANQGMAVAVQRMVGVDSQYRVVANGRLADGRLASWQEIDTALATLRDAVGGGYTEQAIQLGPLWQDFVEVGLSLVDGAARKPEIPSPKYGTRDAVVISGADVALPPAAAYRFSPAVAAKLGNLGVPQIDPCDLRLCDLALGEISRRDLTMTLASEQDGLRAWRDQVRRTYAGRVGEVLLGELDGLRAEIDQLMGRLRSPAEAGSASGDSQDRLGGRMRIATIVGFLGLLALVLTWVLGIISAGVAAIIGLVGAAFWSVGMFMMFIRSQRDVFALVNRLETDANQEPFLRARLATALAELDRISVAYRQYQDWARILGSFLAEPLGVNDVRHRPEPQLMRGRLPRCVQLGSVIPGQDAVAVAARLRRRLYEVGWLSGPYSDLMLRAQVIANPARLGDRQPNHALAFADICKPYSPALRKFADEIWTQGVGPAGGQRLRDQALELLGSTAFQSDLKRLTEQVKWAGNQSPPEESLHSGAESQFDPAPLHIQNVEDDRRVDPDMSRLFSATFGLGTRTSLMQFSRPFPPADLNFGGSAGPDTSQRPQPPRWQG